MELFSIKVARAVLLMASVLLVSASARGQYITLTLYGRLPSGGFTNVSSPMFNIASNELATVVHLSMSPGAELKVVCGGVTNSYEVADLVGGSYGTTYPLHSNLPIIAGPASFYLSADIVGTTRGIAFCTVQITKPSSNFTPINTVVIPNDSSGPVTVMLESSADMVTWVTANPGTYGTTATNRFFRVRAQR